VKDVRRDLAPAKSDIGVLDPQRRTPTPIHVTARVHLHPTKRVKVLLVESRDGGLTRRPGFLVFCYLSSLPAVKGQKPATGHKKAEGL
jgi:hypothetical protein